MPNFNKGPYLKEAIESVINQTYKNWNLYIIDDCSSDSTVNLIEKRPDLYDLLIKQPKNGGKGAAVKAGLQSSKGDYILFQDADLEYDPSDYVKLIYPVLNFNADVVMGSRMVASQITRVSYFWHRVGNKFITFLFNILNNTTFTDVYSCYLLYKSSLVDPSSLLTRGWEQHAEILSNAIINGSRFYEVPINYYGRTYDEGKKIRAYNVLPVIATMLIKRIFK